MQKLKTKESRIVSGFNKFSQRAKDFTRIQKKKSEINADKLLMEAANKYAFENVEDKHWEEVGNDLQNIFDGWEEVYKKGILLLQFQEIHRYCMNNKLAPKMNIDDFRSYYLNNLKRFSSMNADINCEPNFGSTGIKLQIILIDGIRALYCKHSLYYALGEMEERHSITHLPLLR